MLKFLRQKEINTVRHLLGSGYRPVIEKDFTMADQIDEMNAVLDEHAKQIETVEGFMAEFVKRAEGVVDPTRLQAVIDRIKVHNGRLAELLAKFPLIK